MTDEREADGDPLRTVPAPRRTRGRWAIAASLAAVTALIAVAFALDGPGGDDPDDGAAPGTTLPSATNPTGDTTELLPDVDPPVETTAPATTTTQASPEATPCPAEQLTDRQRVGQLVMVGVDPARTGHAREVVEDRQVGGIFIGGDDPTLIASGTLPDLTGPAGIAPFVAVDDEGGRVQRIEMLDGDLPSARELARTSSLEEVTDLARRRGERLASYGITVDFAPVLDVSAQGDREVIGDRSFGSDPDTVTRNARAFAAGLRQAGVTVVFKHFPGHGHAVGDSHLGASTAPAIGDLGPDLAPYRTLLPEHPGAAVMVGHLTVPGLTGSVPASISPAAIAGLLRTDLGFDGLVFTDELGGMRAVSDRYGKGEAARRALVAGADVALFAHPTDVDALLDDLEADLADGDLPRATVDAALGRVLRAKGHACP